MALTLSLGRVWDKVTRGRVTPLPGPLFSTCLVEGLEDAS